MHCNIISTLSFSVMLAFVSPALAISDDANPWLAIENAICVSHLGVDYSTRVDAEVQVLEAQWRGAADGLPMHCYLSGFIDGHTFVIRLPTDWNQQIYGSASRSGDQSQADLSGALNQGYGVLFSISSETAQGLLRAMTDHQYRELGSVD